MSKMNKLLYLIKEKYHNIKNSIIRAIMIEHELKNIIKEKDSKLEYLKLEFTIAQGMAKFYETEYLKLRNKSISSVSVDPKWPKFLFNWIMNSPRDKVQKLDPDIAGKFIYEVYIGKIPRQAAKQVWLRMLDGDTWGIGKKLEEDIDFVAEVIKDNPDLVKKYKSGKTTVIDFIAGKAVKLSNNMLNPTRAKERALEILNA